MRDVSFALALSTILLLNPFQARAENSDCGHTGKFAVNAGFAYAAARPLGEENSAPPEDLVHVEISAPVVPNAGVLSAGERSGEQAPGAIYKTSLKELPSQGDGTLERGFFETCSFKSGCSKTKWSSAISPE